jgi:quinohemoprotein ethanol dehydrogenase
LVATDFIIDDALAQQGDILYNKCANCHGDGMWGGSMAPDLRASLIPLSKEAFTSVVRDGLKTEMGMPSFPYITDDELESLRHFIRKMANETLPVYEGFIASKNNSQVSESGDAGH